MLQPYNISDAIKLAKQARRGKKDTIKAIKGISRQRVQRILQGKSKASIKELEDICTAHGLQLAAINSAELNKIGQIMAILGQNEGKVGE